MPAVPSRKLSHNPPVDLINIQGHKTVYGSVSETGVQSGMTFSGTGWSIAKLGPVAGGSYRIQADVPSGSSVQFITSPNNMLRTYYDGSRYVLGGRRKFVCRRTKCSSSNRQTKMGVFS